MKFIFIRSYGFQNTTSFFRINFAILLFATLLGCATPYPVRREPLIGKDPFQAVAGEYREKAIAFEKRNELRKALFSWQVVQSLQADDLESAKRIVDLETQIKAKSDQHFQRGLEHFRKNSILEARREFIAALTYDPDHEQALNYLKHRLTEPDYILYETKEGDTIRSVAKEIYHDSEKDFLVAYFNDLGRRDKLEPRTILKLPNIRSALGARPAVLDRP